MEKTFITFFYAQFKFNEESKKCNNNNKTDDSNNLSVLEKIKSPKKNPGKTELQD